MQSRLILARGCSHIYYLPFYFQAVQDASVLCSGIRSIPYFASTAILSIVGAMTISRWKHYYPNALLGCALLTIGAGLIYSLKAHASAGQWIGYQIIAGAGVGLSVQISYTAVQSTIKTEDVPLACKFAPT